MGKSLEFLFDLMSPYSYLAATQLHALSKRAGAEVKWVPVYLPGIMRAVGNRGPTEVPPKALHTLKDLNDWAKHYGLPEVGLPEVFPFQAAQACRLCIAAGDRCPELALAFFRRIWAEKQNVNDEAVLREALTEAGLDVEQTLARGQSEEVRAKLKANTDDAVSRGAYGVPTFYIGGTGEMFVGNDRLMFVERALKS